jgi:hypothetical protein
MSGAVFNGSIYYSNDYGVSFTIAASTSGIYWQKLTSSASGLYQYAGYNGGVYISNTYGQTWSQVTGGPFSGTCGTITCSASGQYVMTAGANIYYSTNYGQSWTTASSTTFTWNSIACSSSGQYAIASNTASSNGIYYSTNYGVTWTQVTVSYNNVVVVSISSSGQYALVNSGTSVYLSTTRAPGLFTSGSIIANTANVSGTSSSYNNGILNVTNTNISPLTSLSVLGPNATGNVSMLLGTAATSNNSFFINHTYVGSGSTSNYFSINAYSQQAGTGLYLTAGGNVGIGTTAPNISLDVWGTNNGIGRARTFTSEHYADKRDGFYIGRWDGGSAASPNQFLGMRCVVDSGANSGISGAFDNQGWLSFYTWGNSIAGYREVMRIDSRGYVGIGTTFPGAQLQLKSTTTDRSTCLNIVSPQAGIYLDSASSTGHAWNIWSGHGSSGDPKSLNFYDQTAGAFRMVIDNTTGYVGINTNAPAYMLDVNGSIRASTLTSSVALNITTTGGVMSFSGGGSAGPITIDPNFASNSYVLLYDDVRVSGNFSATGKSFSIPHPIKEKRDNGYFLFHSCVESPTRGECINRYTVEITDLSYCITMPDYYYYLCEDIMVSITSINVFGMSKHNIVINDELKSVTININVTENGKYNIIIYGTRKDNGALNSKFQVEKQMEDNYLQTLIDNSHSKNKNCGCCDDCISKMDCC